MHEVLAIDEAEAVLDPVASIALKLGGRRLNHILALTVPVPGDMVLTQFRRRLRAAALAVRAKLRGPSKLGRRMRRKHELGLDGRY